MMRREVLLALGWARAGALLVAKAGVWLWQKNRPRRVYLSSRCGSDANDGFSRKRPVATLQCAVDRAGSRGIVYAFDHEETLTSQVALLTGQELYGATARFKMARNEYFIRHPGPTGIVDSCGFYWTGDVGSCLRGTCGHSA